MRRYLLDSNAVNDLINRRDPLAQRVREARKRGDRIGTCEPVIGELYYGKNEGDVAIHPLEAMPRQARTCPGGLAYHVWNRAAGRLRLFNKPEDYAAGCTTQPGPGEAGPAAAVFPVVPKSMVGKYAHRTDANVLIRRDTNIKTAQVTVNCEVPITVVDVLSKETPSDRDFPDEIPPTNAVGNFAQYIETWSAEQRLLLLFRPRPAASSDLPPIAGHS